MGAYGVAAFGPRASELHGYVRTWVEGELSRVAVRLAQRHRTFVAQVLLSPGVGELWAKAAISAGAPYDVWLPHPGMLDHWPPDLAAGAYKLISGARELVVPCSEHERFDPRMHGVTLRTLGQAVEAEVLVWTGSTTEYLYSVTRGSRRRPAQSINYVDRKSQWLPEGV